MYQLHKLCAMAVWLPLHWKGLKVWYKFSMNVIQSWYEYEGLWCCCSLHKVRVNFNPMTRWGSHHMCEAEIVAPCSRIMLASCLYCSCKCTFTSDTILSTSQGHFIEGVSETVLWASCSSVIYAVCRALQQRHYQPDVTPTVHQGIQQLGTCWWFIPSFVISRLL